MKFQHPPRSPQGVREQPPGQQELVGHAGGVDKAQRDGVLEAVPAVVVRVAHQKQGTVPQLRRPAATLLEQPAAQAPAPILQPDAQGGPPSAPSGSQERRAPAIP